MQRLVLPASVAIMCARACVLAAGTPSDAMVLLTAFRREFVEITPGRDRFPADFIMGSDTGGEHAAPLHRVSLKRSFAMTRYEVPQNLWQAVMGNNPSRWKGPRNAAEMFSYDEATEFCRRVTVQLRDAGLIEAKQIVRLPSEAEWEYAARAGTTTRYAFGDDIAPLDEYAWSHRNAAGNDPPVGAKRPNAWGLYDMHGYLWEWCADSWHDRYDGAPTDATPWSPGAAAPTRVLRGGSWKDPAERLTSSYRRPAPRSLADDAVGLRCVLAEE
jgi:formylglycine-generating enzyme required for sulfatase activity